MMRLQYCAQSTSKHVLATDESAWFPRRVGLAAEVIATLPAQDCAAAHSGCTALVELMTRRVLQRSQPAMRDSAHCSCTSVLWVWLLV